MKHKTLTITTYMDIWRSLDKTLPVAKQLEYIDSCMDKLTDHDHEEKAKFIAFQGFIGTVNKTIYYLNQRSRNADQEEVQISLMPTESAVCSIEALYFTKKLLAASTLKLDYFFGQPEAKVLTICFGMPPRDKICDGCNVFPPHEHRCHHGSMYIKDQPVKDAYCDCPGCRESETLMAIGAFRDEDFMKKLELFPN